MAQKFPETYDIREPSPSLRGVEQVQCERPKNRPLDGSSPNLSQPNVNAFKVTSYLPELRGSNPLGFLLQNSHCSHQGSSGHEMCQVLKGLCTKPPLSFKTSMGHNPLPRQDEDSSPQHVSGNSKESPRQKRDPDFHSKLSFPKFSGPEHHFGANNVVHHMHSHPEEPESIPSYSNANQTEPLDLSVKRRLQDRSKKSSSFDQPVDEIEAEDVSEKTTQNVAKIGNDQDDGALGFKPSSVQANLIPELGSQDKSYVTEDKVSRILPTFESVASGTNRGKNSTHVGPTNTSSGIKSGTIQPLTVYPAGSAAQTRELLKSIFIRDFKMFIDFLKMTRAYSRSVPANVTPLKHPHQAPGAPSNAPEATVSAGHKAVASAGHKATASSGHKTVTSADPEYVSTSRAPGALTVREATTSNAPAGSTFPITFTLNDLNTSDVNPAAHHNGQINRRVLGNHGSFHSEVIPLDSKKLEQYGGVFKFGDNPKWTMTFKGNPKFEENMLKGKLRQIIEEILIHCLGPDLYRYTLTGSSYKTSNVNPLVQPVRRVHHVKLAVPIELRNSIVELLNNTLPDNYQFCDKMTTEKMVRSLISKTCSRYEEKKNKLKK